MLRCVPATLMLVLAVVGPAVPVAAQERLDELFEDEPGEDEADAEPGVETRLELDSERLSALSPAEPASDAHTLGLELGWYLPIGPGVALGGGVAAELEALRDEDSPRRAGGDGRPRWREESRLKLDELYVERVFGAASSGLRIGLGRRELDDGNGWWWDAPLDAIYVFGRARRWLTTFVAGRLAPEITTDADRTEPEEASVRWALGALRWPRAPVGDLSLLALARVDASASTAVGARVPERDADASDANLAWLGLRLARALGRTRSGEWRVELDVGLMGGRERLVSFVEEGGEDDDDAPEADIGLGEDAPRSVGAADAPETLEAVAARRRDVNGWAFDVALGWRLAAPMEPELLLRYASASGSSTEELPGPRTFRRPELQGDGADTARYGELYEPALSNIDITSLSFAVSPLPSTRLVVVHHRYRRRIATGWIGEAGIDVEPARADRDLGAETGLYLAGELGEDVEAQLLWSRFSPGEAYAGELERAVTLVELAIEIEF